MGTHKQQNHGRPSCTISRNSLTSSYAKYVDSGREVGYLFHPFLAYVRALQRHEFDVTSRIAESNKVPPESCLPLLHLSQLKLMRPLPWTPVLQKRRR